MCNSCNNPCCNEKPCCNENPCCNKNPCCNENPCNENPCYNDNDYTYDNDNINIIKNQAIDLAKQNMIKIKKAKFLLSQANINVPD